MDNISNILTERIRTLRKDAGLTQEELAEKLGVTFQAVSKWETGQCAPDITLLPSISDIFKCSIDHLFAREAPGEPDDTPSGDIPWEDDGIYRGVVFKGRKIISAEETADTFVMKVEGDVKELHGYCGVEVHGDVYQSVTASCGVSVEGDVNGSCSAEGGISVGGDVSGNCECEGGITVGGDVEGNCSAEGAIVICGDVAGNCSAEGSITFVKGDFPGGAGGFNLKVN